MKKDKFVNDDAFEMGVNEEIVDGATDEVTVEATVEQTYEPAPVTLTLNAEGKPSIVLDGTPVELATTNDGLYFKLPKNPSNRQWYSVKKFNDAINKGPIVLEYKASRTLGAATQTHYPNERLIAYLSEDEQVEYKAIIDRAREAMKAARTSHRVDPNSAEGIKAKIARLNAQLEKLNAGE